LSLANLDAEGAFSKFKRDQGDLVIGLDVSLRMMENVLNDVLSFSRMESGSLILSSKPFNIHWTMQHVALAHRATAGAGNLSFTLELDPRVDAIGGVVFGDEMRFKQVLCNLVSNALKFTQQGSVKMVTKLLFPTLGTGIDTKSSSKDTKEYPDTPSEKNPATISVGSVDLSDPLPKVTSNPISKAVVRFEVHDTGPGLSLSDVSDNRLFSPYVQTEIGRRQGGKGSGLGLALVTQIVRLGRGRLGVDSQPGIGSVFW
jgi:signal transduction histidine kinase